MFNFFLINYLQILRANLINHVKNECQCLKYVFKLDHVKKKKERNYVNYHNFRYT